MPIIVKHQVHPYSNAFGNRVADQHLPHTCFRRISPQRFLVSRFVAKTWQAFRSLWQESGRQFLQEEHDENVGPFGVGGVSSSPCAAGGAAAWPLAARAPM
jgi:hypothetical protein